MLPWYEERSIRICVGECLRSIIPWGKEPPDASIYFPADLITDLWVLDPAIAETIARNPLISGYVIDNFGTVALHDSGTAALYALRSIARRDIEMARTLVDLPWIEDDVVFTTGILNGIASHDLEIARMVMDLPWVANNGTNINNRNSALEHLYNIASRNPDLARTVVGLPWVADGDITQVDLGALGVLDRNLESARALATLPWFVDGVTDDEIRILFVWAGTVSSDHGDPLEATRLAANLPALEEMLAGITWFSDDEGRWEERNAIIVLSNIASNDQGLAKTVASLPWFTDDITEEELDALDAFKRLASTDAEISKMLAARPWFTDGVTPEETYALQSLRQLASNDAGLASLIANSPWFPITVIYNLDDGLSILSSIWSTSPELARTVANLPWFTNDITEQELRALNQLDHIATTDAELAKMVANLPWFTDDITEQERWTLGALYNIATTDAELAKMVANLPWFTDDITTEERQSLDSLYNIATEAADLARTIAALPWFTDDITTEETFALQSLRQLASMDADLAKTIAESPGFIVTVTYDRYDRISPLSSIAAINLELARITVNTSWFTDGVTSDEHNAIRLLSRIASDDADLAKTVVALPWFTDELTPYEIDALLYLDEIVYRDVELATMVAGLPWITDGVSEEDSLALQGLFFVAAPDVELATMVANSPWFIDGVTGREVRSLNAINRIAETDVELATMVAGLPWITDGVTEREGRALNAIRHIAGIDRDLASELAASVKDPTGDLDIHAIEALGGIASHGDDALGRLTSQPWYADGLSDEEYALVVVLNGALRQSSSMYDDLLRTHFIQTETVLLSLAREVNIYVIQNTPFSSHEDLPRLIKESARAIENFVGEPFPTTDIILHVVVDSGYRVHGMHLYNYMQLVRAQGRVWFIPHETAHYYFYSDAGPVWYVEGIANFLDAHVNEQIGVPVYSERRAESATTVRSTCRYNNEPIENIRHYNYILDRVHAGDWFSLNREDKFWICVYPMGDNLLFAVHDAIGEDAMSAAVRELYLQNLDSGQPAEEEVIFRAFLKHTPSNKKGAFLDVYRRLHGGAFAFDDVDFDDDHGDQAALATEIAVGETAEGTLDYMFDFDYFKFPAEGGQRYRINVIHPSLRTSSVTMYSRDGTTRLGRRVDTPESSAEVASGVRILWTARRDGMYHVAVQNFGGKTGSYTLTITPVDDDSDD